MLTIASRCNFLSSIVRIISESQIIINCKNQPLVIKPDWKDSVHGWPLKQELHGIPSLELLELAQPPHDVNADFSTVVQLPIACCRSHLSTVRGCSLKFLVSIVVCFPGVSRCMGANLHQLTSIYTFTRACRTRKTLLHTFTHRPGSIRLRCRGTPWPSLAGPAFV